MQQQQKQKKCNNVQCVKIITCTFHGRFSFCMHKLEKRVSSTLHTYIYIYCKKETQKFEEKGTGGPGTFEKSPGTFGLL